MKTRIEANEAYVAGIRLAREGRVLTEFLRALALRDLFFLLVYVLHREDVDNHWCYKQCRMVQAAPDGYIDLWARGHYKSTIITFALLIQSILRDPEVTIGIFSHTRPIAKAFMSQVKREFEANELLKSLFPDILYADPRNESPTWSEDKGLLVKRKGNPKEMTVEAYGLTDGQPTSKHFRIMNYDDIVTKESVSTPAMIEKTTQAWAESLNLCAENATFRYAGTRWHFADTSSEIIKRKAAIARVFTPTVDGTLDGEPVLWSRETLAKKWTDMGAFVAAAQLFQNPKLENTDGFLEGWLQYWPALTYANMNLYLLCDPAGEKKESSDYTVFMVVGLGPDQNYYVITMVRDRLSLAERTRVLFSLHQQYKPLITGYEKYGLQSDIEHIRSVQAQTNYRFGIKELGGAMPKVERIRRLGPKFEAGRVFLPETCARVNYLKERVDLVQAFRQEEYLAFPYSEHDDMLDCLSRIFDVGPVFPNAVDALSTFSERESNRDNSFDPLRFGL